jgi:MFS superfamily sulfate permease-like transporter
VTRGILSRLTSLVPALSWLRTYQSGWLRADLVAGITLAAYLLPAGLGDASLANLPPQAGLYACLFGGLVFWLFCSSRQTSITVTSAISLLVGASLGEIAGGDVTRFSALAAGTALLVALIGFIAWLAKAGSIINFNMDHVHDTIAERVRVAASPCKFVVLDLSAAPYVDMHAAHMLADLSDELAAVGIRVQAVEARSAVRERLRNEGVDEKPGLSNRFASVADAVEAFKLEFSTSYL